MRIFLANGHIQCSGYNLALLTMAVGQMALVSSPSRGVAPGYVERGLWPKEGAVNAGAELIAESSLITKRPTNPIPASLVSLVAGVFRSPNFIPTQVMARSEQWWRRLPAAQPSGTRASRPPAAVRPLDDFCWCSCWQCGRDARVPASHRGRSPACQSQTRWRVSASVSCRCCLMITCEARCGCSFASISSGGI